MTSRVLLVETTGALSRVLGPLFGREVVCEQPSASARTLASRVRTTKPTVVLVEVTQDVPETQRAIEVVMAETPVAIVLVSVEEHRPFAFPLLAAGALDVISMPRTLDAELIARFRQQLALWSKVRVLRHPKGRRKRATTRSGLKVSQPLVAIAASLGGPRALAQVLAGLEPSFGAPILVCQHITPGFEGGLAQWLAAETGLTVREATEGETPKRGVVLVAPGNRHLEVHSTGRIHLGNGPAVGGFKPSCDVMFRSVAASFGNKAIGVILTGMGRDGAKGLLEIRQHGGHTIGQDEASCVVYGMPREAAAIGAVEHVLPLEHIAGHLRQVVK